MAGIDVHLIRTEHWTPGFANGPTLEVYCTCGWVSRGWRTNEAHAKHDAHIVAAIRANRAADKTGA